MVVFSPPSELFGEGGSKRVKDFFRNVSLAINRLAVVDRYTITKLMSMTTLVHNKPLLGYQVYLDMPLFNAVVRLHKASRVKAFCCQQLVELRENLSAFLRGEYTVEDHVAQTSPCRTCGVWLSSKYGVVLRSLPTLTAWPNLYPSSGFELGEYLTVLVDPHSTLCYPCTKGGPFARLKACRPFRLSFATAMESENSMLNSRLTGSERLQSTRPTAP